MPIQAYACMDCEKHWDELVRNPAEEPQKCPSCGGENFQRSLTTPGGYNIRGNNSGSTRPKGAGSFRKSK